MTARTPTITDAARRAPVTIHQPGRPPTTGRLISIGGDRRTPNGRARVQLPSGAYLTPLIADVELHP